MTSSDVLVVLGVDRLGGDSQWQASNIARRMMDIRAGLLQIVPTGDGVGLPVGATVPIVLRDVTVEAAQDISRALLSHLSPLLAGYEEGAVHARICIGLAQVKQGHSPLAAIMAANNALLLLQQGNGDDLIAVAEERDEQLLAARAINADGIFSENHSPAQTCAYLADLTRLDADPLHPGNYLAAVVALTLRQPDVAAVGVYRRSHDDSYNYVAGGLDGAGEPGQEHGEEGLAESRLPRALREQRRKLDTVQLRERECIAHPGSRTSIFPLKLHNSVLGYLALHYQQSADPLRSAFIPDIAALHYLATELSTMTDWRQAREDFTAQVLPPVQPIDYQLDGYVDDNLEGAIDQAVFLSRVDVPVAVIGPRGTGKLYVAKVIHQEAGAPPEMLVAIDCRGFRSRKEALNRIARELEKSADKTLVFKSPHLLNPDVQLKLARQISSRILADTSPPRYVPAARFVALFPDNLEHLVQHGELNEKLASVFAGYPILVPPIRDRKRAVLRWAHKILAQEAVRRDRKIKGFTPDGEQAMLRYEWPGNISEMRQTIASALDKTDKEWVTPVDLGLFKGISPGQAAGLSDKRPFLQSVLDEVPEEQAYTPTGLDELGVALGEALHSMLELDSVKPLGAWLDDEVVLAVCERYRGNMPGAAQFLHTRARNISRWMPKIVSRDHDRNASSLWQVPRRLIKQWLKETAPLDEAPLQVVQAILMSHVVRQCESMGVADRARIMGVSTPTYQKRLQEIYPQ
jgi:DNA-binding NtrC family response regulator